MEKETKAVHSGRYPLKYMGAINPPIYQASTLLFPSLQAYQEAERGKAHYEINPTVKSYDCSYAITGTPTNHALQEALATLEEAENCIIVPSGLSAIITVLFGCLKAGDHLLMVDSVYGPTRRFCNNELKRFGVEVEYYDPLIGDGIKDLIKENTAIVYTESPGSLTFEVQDIPAITRAAKAANPDIVTVMDNSWASPLYFKPFQYGIDISIHAVTKYIGGHSDVILGSITTNDEHFAAVFQSFYHLGNSPSPYECYLAQRGIRTMPTRIKQHEKTALTLAHWLAEHPKVSRVLHPALESCPGHEIWKRDFTGSTGLFSVVLDQKYDFDALSQMIDPMELFGIGCSWGGYESLVLAPDPSGSRTANKWEAEGNLIRFYAGLEDPQDLLADLEKAFARL